MPGAFTAGQAKDSRANSGAVWDKQDFGNAFGDPTWEPEDVDDDDERPRRRRRRVRPSPVRIYKPGADGNPELQTIRNDDVEIRRVLDRHAAAAGTTLADLTPCLRRGRPSPNDERRIILASAITELRQKDARLEAIGRVLGCNKSTILRLGIR